MTKQVTEEMISAFIDGELSPEDKQLVETAISTDESLRQLLESFKESSQAIQDSSSFVLGSTSLPSDFSARVMSKIASAESGEESAFPDQTEKHRSNINAGTAVELSKTKSTGKFSASQISLRTWIEVIVASVAILVVVVNWPTANQPQIAQPETKPPQQVSKNGVRMMGSKNGQFEKSDPRKSNEPSKQIVSSREFSIFIDSGTRPEVDRFWIMNNYEVSAPENTEPDGTNSGGVRSKVNVLMIDSKKADAVKFFSQLSKWDSGFQIFQEAKSGSASWLAPFDIAKAAQAEGDFWTLKIVLIEP